ncbi:family 20 glycosylhydrolase [Shivajiella indica]|uniref:beta-N-acetylhexosaminidase n=1 Tax=Shivajiella indica TaxID=872115 RepID=A0ABW5B9P7_9BACT
MVKYACYLILLSLVWGCSSPIKSVDIDEIYLNWELITNEVIPGQNHEARFTLTNKSNAELTPDWEIYFNTIFLSLTPKITSGDILIEHLSGDFFRIKPGPEFPGIGPGESFSFSYASDNFLVKNSHAPQGLYIVRKEKNEPEIIRNYQAKTFALPDLKTWADDTSLPIPTIDFLFEENKNLKLLSQNEYSPIIPTPKSLQWGNSHQIYSGDITINQSVFEKSGSFLKDRLQEHYNGKVSIETKSEATIHIEKAPNVLAKEGYELEIGNRIIIKASDEKGAFYGVQSLLALMPLEFYASKVSEFLLPEIYIQDEPRFGYRGLFLDVARNFQSKQSVLKLLDLMAFYKLNVFHFNLANDEGWRIEIPGLPELTEIGSKRGHSKDEVDFLWPYYSSGPDKDNSPNGSGFYSSEDFMEILQYAHERNIEVIPEIGVPAHSRAAIISMRKRFHNKMKSGDEQGAMEYLLEDFEDKSEYLSAQNFRGNAICICQESAFNFYEKVIDEILLMYKKANVPIKTFHTGGDEVPKGSWTKSPVCEKFIAETDGLNSVHDLTDYFYSRIFNMFNEKGLQTAGWEEIGQMEGSENGKMVARPNPEFANKGFRVYAWNSVAGWGGEDMAYQLANAGYEVVVCNSSNIYFDLAYNMDPDEPGHQWSGYVDLKTAWRTVPMNHFVSNERDMYGRKIDIDALSIGKEKLTENGKKNIKGIQGQLWTETVKGQDMMEYYLLPKMLGLVERAWAVDPNWTSISNYEERIKARESDWNAFANAVGQRELPRLDYLFGGFNTRIPKPGVKVEDGLLYANVETPGLLIRYTKNGEDPDEKSPIITAGLAIEGKINLKVFTPSGRSGNLIVVNK